MLMLVWEGDRLTGLLWAVYLNHSLTRKATLILQLLLGFQYIDQEALSLDVYAKFIPHETIISFFFPKAAFREVD